MTLIVGANLGLYCILAADCRETFLGPANQEHTFRDDYKKVLEIPSGLIAGAGLTAVTDAVANALATESDFDASDPEELSGFFREFVRSFGQQAAKNAPPEHVQPHLTRFGWLLTSLEAGRPTLRMYQFQSGFKPLEIEEGVPQSLIPFDMTPEQSLANEMALMTALQICRRPTDVDDTFDHNLQAIVRYFKAQSTVSKMLGTAIQIGSHSIDGTVEITDIMPLNEL